MTKGCWLACAAVFFRGLRLSGAIESDRAGHALWLLWLHRLQDGVDQKVGGLVDIHVVLGGRLEPACESVLAAKAIHLLSIFSKLVASKIDL